MQPSEITVADYQYILPEDRIAKFPLDDRDTSKLLVYRSGEIAESVFSDIDRFLPADSVIFWNNTRVIQARIVFHKPTGGRVEIFLIAPFEPAEYAQSFASQGHCTWNVVLGNQKKWKSGNLQIETNFKDIAVKLTAQWLNPQEKEARVRFEWSPTDLTFAEITEIFGQTPIPPYLRRDPVTNDRERYQTIYATYNGSVAAPTAGLHFTDKTIERLKSKGINFETVTLHVGAGTFIPVKSETISGHTMHSESITITRNSIECLLGANISGITAVGTTTVRTLESLYWLGVLWQPGGSAVRDMPEIDQWMPYSGLPEIDVRTALETVLHTMDSMNQSYIRFTTRLLILPGYRFRLVNRLITNFHQPGSTLLLLIAAAVGDKWKEIYRYALDQDFRFLSYGDSSLLEWDNRQP